MAFVVILIVELVGKLEAQRIRLKGSLFVNFGFLLCHLVQISIVLRPQHCIFMSYCRLDRLLCLLSEQNL